MTREDDHDFPEATSRAGRGGNIPPIEHRWQKGRSANPAGRPRGSQDSFGAIIERELARRVDGNPALGDRGRVSRRTRLARAILDRAEAGDGRLAKLVLERLWPAPVNGRDLTQPVVVLFDDQDRELMLKIDGD